jgi:hypothetical protein
MHGPRRNKLNKAPKWLKWTQKWLKLSLENADLHRASCWKWWKGMQAVIEASVVEDRQ